MRIVVTGGAGFIGSHVVDGYVAAGHEVIVLDSLWERGGGRREFVNPNVKFFELDIRDPGIADVLQSFRPDVVSHHAAQASVAISMRDPLYDADVNIKGLLNALEAAVRCRARKVVFASSSATYGTPQYLPMNEEHPQRPQSAYGISKLAGEHYLRCYTEAHGLRHTILRYGNVYGPRQDPSGEAGVIAIFSKRILQGEPIRIDWDGEQQKDYIFVADVARVNLLALETGDDETFNIGTGIGTSVNALHEAIARVIGRDVDVVRAPKRPGDVHACVFAIEKARQVLGWMPHTSLAEGIKKTLEFFRAES